MTKQFVQVSARKDSNNFAHCSNLSLMANEGLTSDQALRKLQVMADDMEGGCINVEYPDGEVIEEIELDIGRI